MNSISDQRWENLGYLAEEVCGKEHGWAVRGRLNKVGMSHTEIEAALERIKKRQGPLWKVVSIVIRDWRQRNERPTQPRA